MKLDDQNIDQIFNDAAHSQSAPQYDASYWNDVEAVLNEESRKKRALAWLASGGMFVFALLVGLLISSNILDNKKRYVRGEQHALRPIQWNSSGNETMESEIMESMFSNTSSTQSNGNSTEKKNAEAFNQRSPLNSSASPLLIAVKDKSANGGNDIEKEGITVQEINDSTKVNGKLEQKHTDIRNMALKLDNSLTPVTHRVLEKNTTNKLLDIEIDAHDGLTAYLQMSGGVMENYKTSRPLESTVMNISAGLMHRHRNLLLRSGIGFQATTNADLIVSQRSKYYGFGVTNNQNDLSYQNLYDLYLPLEFGYELDNTQFGMGIQMNYLVNSSMNLEIYENKDLVERRQYTGVANGLNQLSAQGYLWAEQKIVQQFYLGVKVGTHFYNRLSLGEYINESATTNPIYGQVSIRYNFKK